MDFLRKSCRFHDKILKELKAFSNSTNKSRESAIAKIKITLAVCFLAHNWTLDKVKTFLIGTHKKEEGHV